MSVTITNLRPDLTDPLTQSIDDQTDAVNAQTEFMASDAACQGQALENMYNEPLNPGDCGDTGGASPDPDTPDLNGKTYTESYIALWCDYWKTEKRDKNLRNVLLLVQGTAALVGLVESIQTYNKILDKQLDIICAVKDDVLLLEQCNAALLGTADAPGILKLCQTALLEDHNDRIGTINNTGIAFCEFARDEIDCYEQLWRPIVKKHVPHIASELHTMLENGKISSEYSTSWANGLEEAVSANMLPELKRQFAPLLQSVNCNSINLNHWREELKQDAADLQDHYKRTFQTNEETMIPAVMDMSACMAQRVCELRDWLYDIAKCDMSVYHSGYQSGEAAQAQAAMGTAASLIPKIVDSVQWLETNVPAATELFRCYQAGIDQINPSLFNNAGDLAQEIQVCFKWLRDKAFESKEVYDQCYKERECQIVHKQMDFALKLTSRVHDSLCRLDQWSQDDRVMYDTNFRGPEIQASINTVTTGSKAVDETHAIGHWWDERSKEFHNTYHDYWLPCDIDNLKKHCDLWNSVNPLEEIHRNADAMRDMSLEATGLYEKGLVHAGTYMDEVFARHDRFEYCVQDAASLHIRRRVEQALEELERCTPRFATGHLQARRDLLKAEGAKAEGAAYASGERWKWWANEQLQRKEHSQRLEALGWVDGAAARGLAGNAASTAAHDQLLGHMNQAIGRGQLYTANMQDAGRNTISVKGNEVDAMLRMIQLWHFWPELAANENGQFNQSVHRVHDQARDLVQLGHYWPGQATQDKGNAINVAESAIATGVQLSQIGQYYMTQAENMNSSRIQAAQAAGNMGNAFAATGHNLNQLASANAQATLQQSIGAASPGIQAGNLGAQHMATALEIENRMTLNSLEHLKAGVSSMALGVDFLGEVRQTQELAGSYGMNASAQLMNLFETGRRQSVLGMEANAQCKQTQFDMLKMAKEFVMNNYQITTNALHAGTSGTLNAGNNLLQQQGNNAGGAFGLLGNSLEGLISNNSASTPPFPSGGPTFSGTGGRS